MEKKKWVKLAGFAMVVLLSLFLCTGCSENTNEDNPVSVSFVSAFEDSSRGGLSQEYVSKYVPEGLYWTFTAVKTSGAHSTGASEKDKDGNLIEQPVRGDRGFSGSLHEFSKGGWNFTLYGYVDKNHTQLVYKLVKNDVNITAATTIVFDTLTSATAAEGGVIGDKGCLELGSLCVRIPDNGFDIAVDSIVVVEIYDGNTLVAGCETVIDNATYYTSRKDVFPINAPVFIEGKNLFDAGVKTLTAKVKCRNFPRPGANYEETIMGVFPIVFASKAGVVTKVSGTLGDLALKPIGGKIYHVDTAASAGRGAVYTFYDVNGEVLTTTTVAGLANAKYYSIEGVASKDKYYVYNDSVKSPERLYHYGRLGTRSGNVPTAVLSDDRVLVREEVLKPGSDGIWWRGDTSISAFPKDASVGWGRRNTDFFVRGAWNADWFVNHEGTVWNYLKNVINNPNVDNGTCWFDWYVPSAGEMLYLYNYNNNLARGTVDFGLGSSTGCHSGSVTEVCAGFFGVFFNGGRSNVLYGFGEKQNDYPYYFYFVRSF